MDFKREKINMKRRRNDMIETDSESEGDGDMMGDGDMGDVIGESIPIDDSQQLEFLDDDQTHYSGDLGDADIDPEVLTRAPPPPPPAAPKPLFQAKPRGLPARPPRVSATNPFLRPDEAGQGYGMLEKLRAKVADTSKMFSDLRPTKKPKRNGVEPVVAPVVAEPLEANPIDDQMDSIDQALEEIRRKRETATMSDEKASSGASSGSSAATDIATALANLQNTQPIAEPHELEFADDGAQKVMDDGAELSKLTLFCNFDDLARATLLTEKLVEGSGGQSDEWESPMGFVAIYSKRWNYSKSIIYNLVHCIYPNVLKSGSFDFIRGIRTALEPIYNSKILPVIKEQFSSPEQVFLRLLPKSAPMRTFAVVYSSDQNNHPFLSEGFYRNIVFGDKSDDLALNGKSTRFIIDTISSLFSAMCNPPSDRGVLASVAGMVCEHDIYEKIQHQSFINTLQSRGIKITAGLSVKLRLGAETISTIKQTVELMARDADDEESYMEV
jgi:hypothetical protein